VLKYKNTCCIFAILQAHSETKEIVGRARKLSLPRCALEVDVIVSCSNCSVMFHVQLRHWKSKWKSGGGHALWLILKSFSSSSSRLFFLKSYVKIIESFSYQSFKALLLSPPVGLVFMIIFFFHPSVLWKHQLHNYANDDDDDDDNLYLL
jgi:hypothetical protein